ncbi:pyrroline-5-carboxylate reductase [Maritimibacter sp. 55A14]|uniref:pyrroline-5-carboxylate reductase family protein n=1 Tax=Maritimibacter sp. 55A14 TaxID=2174844 RepID=UPI000D60A69D|nr:pyrroline-5-carboxylate reductase dimerization domain-containing protein [Maritimibacter sp. 55A14]PWE32672.1 pyrroline-5-carboxylate reductase [Maritimibacter sp. 55A14]
MEQHTDIGIIGGNGALGSALARALLRTDTVGAGRLWVSCRSGAAPALADWPGIHVTDDNQALAERCATIVLAIPPVAMDGLAIAAPDALVISVMAGPTAERIAGATGARAVIRAMSSPPAADLGLAFSPFWAGPGASAGDRETARALLAAAGETAELDREDQVDLFTAITGPVPGVLAAVAEAIRAHAGRHGTPPDIAALATRQLFRASGAIMADPQNDPADYVAEMIAYAGTTAAALETLRRGPLAEAIAEALDAAAAKARDMG